SFTYCIPCVLSISVTYCNVSLEFCNILNTERRFLMDIQQEFHFAIRWVLWGYRNAGDFVVCHQLCIKRDVYLVPALRSHVIKSSDSIPEGELTFSVVLHTFGKRFVNHDGSRCGVNISHLSKS